MTTPDWHLPDNPSPEEVEWACALWWLQRVVPPWIDDILSNQMVMLYFERGYV